MNADIDSGRLVIARFFIAAGLPGDYYILLRSMIQLKHTFGGIDLIEFKLASGTTVAQQSNVAPIRRRFVVLKIFAKAVKCVKAISQVRR